MLAHRVHTVLIDEWALGVDVVTTSTIGGLGPQGVEVIGARAGDGGVIADDARIVPRRVRVGVNITVLGGEVDLRAADVFDGPPGCLVVQRVRAGVAVDRAWSRVCGVCRNVDADDAEVSTSSAVTVVVDCPDLIGLTVVG